MVDYKCEKCKGTGIIETHRHGAFGEWETDRSTCPRCGGKGLDYEKIVDAIVDSLTPAIIKAAGGAPIWKWLNEKFGDIDE